VRDRNKKIADYAANQDILADELEQLFEPYKAATDAVLHNRVIDLITELCGEEEAIDTAFSQDFDEKQKTVRVLKCKDKLAKSLAHSVIRHARLQDE
jgi:hypothetical protein